MLTCILSRILCVGINDVGCSFARALANSVIVGVWSMLCCSYLFVAVVVVVVVVVGGCNVKWEWSREEGTGSCFREMVWWWWSWKMLKMLTVVVVGGVVGWCCWLVWLVGLLVVAKRKRKG